MDKLPHAVMVALIDFKKGFNRLNHNKIITHLSDWGVPGWILKILCSYLTEVWTHPHLYLLPSTQEMLAVYRPPHLLQ